MSTASQHELAVERWNSGYLIRCGSTILHENVLTRALAPTLRGWIAQTALREGSYFLSLHAAALHSGRGSYLLAGKAGSGKSTLTASLIRAGHRYYSDDIALLSEKNQSVRPFPISFGIKEGSWPLLSPQYAGLADAPIHVRNDGKMVRYLTPEVSARMPFEADSAPVETVLFPTYADVGTTVLEEMGKGEAARRILTNECYVPKWMSDEYVARFVGWLRSVKTYRLRFHDVNKGVEAVLSVTR